MTDPTKQPLPSVSPALAALDAPLGGPAQPPAPAEWTDTKAGLPDERVDVEWDCGTGPSCVGHRVGGYVYVRPGSLASPVKWYKRWRPLPAETMPPPPATGTPALTLADGWAELVTERMTLGGAWNTPAYRAGACDALAGVASLRQPAPVAASKPLAWLVYMPKGHEFDYKVFAEEREAQDQAAALDDDLPEGEETEVVPLYAASEPAPVADDGAGQGERREVRHVVQEDANGCGVACLAMVLGVTYADAVKMFRERFWEDYSFHNAGMQPQWLDVLLADQGYAVQRRWKNTRDPKWAEPFAPLHVCNVCSPTGGHLVVMLADGSILDPRGNRGRLSDYPDLHDVAGLWKVRDMAASVSPVPVAAVERGVQRWGLIDDAGELALLTHRTKASANECNAQDYGCGTRVVPVRVTVLADDAGTDGAIEQALDGGWKVVVKPRDLSVVNAEGQTVGRFRNATMALASLAFVLQRLAAAEARADKLQAFKTYVHQRLDAAGVPHHPPGPHGAEGCRVGDRLDWLLGRFAFVEQMRTALDTFADPACWEYFEGTLSGPDGTAQDAWVWKGAAENADPAAVARAALGGAPAAPAGAEETDKSTRGDIGDTGREAVNATELAARVALCWDWQSDPPKVRLQTIVERAVLPLFARLAAAEAARAAAEGEATRATTACETLNREWLDMRKERDRLRTALEWYADAGNYQVQIVGTNLTTPAEVDAGSRARAALAAPAGGAAGRDGEGRA